MHSLDEERRIVTQGESERTIVAIGSEQTGLGPRRAVGGELALADQIDSQYGSLAVRFAIENPADRGGRITRLSQ